MSVSKWLCVWWALALVPIGAARAEWQELSKDDDVAYYYDKDSVMPVHVSRYAWTLVDLSKNDKAPNGETYKSAMIRWRMYCKTDMVVPLSVSFFDQAMGKGKEVAREDVHEWRLRETPIRPSTYLAALKKEICAAPRQVAAKLDN
jgi:hypothetical protein